MSLDSFFEITEVVQVFTFASNLSGRHGRGSAKEALDHHGAIYGVGVGRQGNSYGIPTKDRNLKILSLVVIEEYVKEFLEYAKENPETRFNVVKIGCGLAGYKDHQIAPFFRNRPENVHIHSDWLKLL